MTVELNFGNGSRDTDDKLIAELGDPAGSAVNIAACNLNSFAKPDDSGNIFGTGTLPALLSAPWSRGGTTMPLRT